jgi:hypothetical protein
MLRPFAPAAQEHECALPALDIERLGDTQPTLANDKCPRRRHCRRPLGCGERNQSSGTYSHAFATAGTSPHFCKVHGSMMTRTVIAGAGGVGGGAARLSIQTSSNLS